MSYEEIPITEELNVSVQRAVGVTPRPHETLEELVKDVAAQRGVRRPENLVSAQPTRDEVRVVGQIFHAYCFVDALMLPFVLQVLQGEGFEVRSEGPMSGGGEVAALVPRESVEASPREAVVSFGASQVGDGPVHKMLCPYLGAFPSREEYEIWAKETPQAVTSALSPEDAFALGRDWASGRSEVPEGRACGC